MGKRSNFPRRKMDAYDTPREAVRPLLPCLAGVKTFAEPCFGNGFLYNHLLSAGLKCTYAGDLKTGEDALKIKVADLAGTDAIITNPPWTRELLHPLILHFMTMRPTWLLFDADWIHTRQAGPFLRHCQTVVSVGRVKWIPGSKHTGKDNAAWHLFDCRHVAGPHFVGRDWEVAA
jgi:hypothetical protein